MLSVWTSRGRFCTGTSLPSIHSHAVKVQCNYERISALSNKRHVSVTRDVRHDAGAPIKVKS